MYYHVILGVCCIQKGQYAWSVEAIDPKNIRNNLHSSNICDENLCGVALNAFLTH